MKIKQIATISGLLVALTSCGIGGMVGPFPGHPEFVSESSSSRPRVPPASPQVVYRIDENRYFEVVPVSQYPCSGTLYYTDKAQAIHKSIAGWHEVSRGDITIDAANTDYLVGPIIRASSNCGADTADRPSCSKRLPYSTDGGRSWKYTAPERTNFGPIVLTGNQVFYAHSTANLNEILENPNAWTVTWENFPTPKKVPVDTQFHCNPDVEERS